MKRDIIIIDNKAVSVTGNDVWMAATEIAGLFHTTVPALMMMDIEMPEMNGIRMIQHINHSHMKVVAMTAQRCQQGG